MIPIMDEIGSETGHYFSLVTDEAAEDWYEDFMDMLSEDMWWDEEFYAHSKENVMTVYSMGLTCSEAVHFFWRPR